MTISTTGPAVVATNISVAYRVDPVLRGVNVEVPQGVVMGIVGPNGSGKSTLLKSMLGLIPTLSGHTEFFGQQLGAVRNHIGYMPQQTSVDWDFPTTVADVVLMGTYGRLGWFRRPGKAEKQRAADAMEQTGITNLADRQIGQLSGGQRQRVFLSRTLAQQPDLYFMDEPFQGVDAYSQQTIVDVMHRLRGEGKTIILVHHDLKTVPDYCDQVTMLNTGRVVSSGPVGSHFTEDLIRIAYGLEAQRP
ncbi:metal ABC transporter ATP-binding protein [Corynebacterium alimapuense]|uniref:Manganese ABC transporter ATP-binding protein n=1 Tax=Corynebacterium alimapuense TaxID=1576874 RepID=A0A3M8K4M4_9CORY|nr:metal ABC transporter ATP-binding protein [Corynebacterium alimapuense]RNE48173.1 manganese ABC transporter ATP-binding protein [Corynebacterium alimapuense]